MARYILLMNVDESTWLNATPEQTAAFGAKVDAYNAELQKVNAMLGGEGFDSSTKAKTVRFGAGGKTTVSDGPFHKVPEQLGGYWLIEAADDAAALAWAKKVPLEAGAIEVRPLV